jgi:hypothetical protein
MEDHIVPLCTFVQQGGTMCSRACSRNTLFLLAPYQWVVDMEIAIARASCTLYRQQILEIRHLRSVPARAQGICRC